MDERDIYVVSFSQYAREMKTSFQEGYAAGFAAGFSLTSPDNPDPAFDASRTSEHLDELREKYHIPNSSDT
jgi:hypothetical protein